MSAEVIKIAPASALKTGDIFRPGKWAGLSAIEKDYVVQESHLAVPWLPNVGMVFTALPLQIFMSLQKIYWPAANKTRITFRESAGLVTIRGNILDEAERYVPRPGDSVVRSGRKRRNGRRAIKPAMVDSVNLCPPNLRVPLYLQVHTNKFNTLGYYPEREEYPHYKIIGENTQRLAL